MVCNNCKHLIDEEARFCPNCGTKINKRIPALNIIDHDAKYSLDFEERQTIATQIRAHFFEVLEQVIEEEFGANEYRKYFDQFYKSDFYKNFDLRTQQLAEEVSIIHLDREGQANLEIDQLLEPHFYAFIDHFLVRYCKSIHQMNLPEAMLKYTNVAKETIDQRELILDYMDFNNEKDKVYIDLLTIPPSKVKNAIKSFLFTQSKEKIFFICDQTVFGSCQEGFAMTERALYWKSHFNEAQSIPYDALKEIKREAEWISINGLFFNVNRTMNYKMLRLLKKLKQLNQV